VVLAGPELEALGRNLKEALQRGWGVRHAAPPAALLELAITIDRLFPATGATSRHGPAAGQEAAAQPRNSLDVAALRASDQPAATLSVRQAAQASNVSEQYIRRLIQAGTLEVAGSQGPGYQVFADSLAAWQERRSRKEASTRKAA